MLTLAPEYSAIHTRTSPGAHTSRLSRCDRDVLTELRRLAADNARRETPPVSAAQLAARLEMSSRKAQKSVARLRDAGLIVTLGCDRAAANDERGMRYHVPAREGGTQSEVGSRAGRDGDRTGIPAIEETPTPAAAHVSRYSRREPLPPTARASEEPGARHTPTLTERALAAWRAERPVHEAEELERRVRELAEFRRALVDLLGTEHEIKVGIGDDGAPVATTDGLEFSPAAEPREVAEGSAGVLLVRRCPRCASAVVSRPLHSLADLGRALEEAAESARNHVCGERL